MAGSKQCIIDVDLATIVSAAADGKFIRMQAWGDEVEVLNYDDIENGTARHVEVRVFKFVKQDEGYKPVAASGFIVSKSVKPADVVRPKEADDVLKCNFVDVQQGDGSVIETPKGKVMLVDGGDNVMFARYLASRFRGTTEEKPRDVECVLVTHGDADHFQGLTEISKSEKLSRSWQRLFIDPKRVYHNGLVKRPGKIGARKRRETEMLGATETVKDPATNKNITLLTELESDLLEVADEKMNEPFRAWKSALKAYNVRRTKTGAAAIEFRRLEKGDSDAFDFLAEENIKIEVLAPIPVETATVKGLKFLGEPPKGPRIGQESLQLDGGEFKGKSASHTINGHSIVFRLTYGRFNFLFTGDLNDEAARVLTRAHNSGELNLQAEVFKVPHHGSADFSGALLQAVSPVISIISSGDESARKEYIHPRATLVGALGKYSRVEEPLIFVTEMVAFFEVVGKVRPEFHSLDENDVCEIGADGLAVVNKKAAKAFFAFSRTEYGIVKIRTNGRRLLVYTNSGQSDLKEAYAYEVDESGKVRPSPVRKV
ncbi:MAG TPA: MBL fold metallo-hydrolase [Pyrinomonadaceae bacterium]|jgi:beta-lactamase superfamily II metal-dependent hydrolase